MSIIAWLVVGGIAGWVANRFLGTPQGLIRTIIFGIVGALVGGYIGGFLTNQDLSAMISGINITSIIVAIIGALIVGGIGAWWSKRGATTA